MNNNKSNKNKENNSDSVWTASRMRSPVTRSPESGDQPTHTSTLHDLHILTAAEGKRAQSPAEIKRTARHTSTVVLISLNYL